MMKHSLFTKAKDFLYGHKTPSHQSLVMAPLRKESFKPYTQMVSEGYMKNIIVYRCISLVARGLSSVPLEAQLPCGQRTQKHPILDLLQEPSFLERIATTLLLSGNAPLALFKSPLSFKLLRPDLVEFDEAENAYSYRDPNSKNGQKIYFTTDKSNKSQIFLSHIHLAHPLNDKIGFSPLQAAALSVDQHNCVSEHNLALLQNGGRPFGALMVKTPHGIPLDEKEREAFKETLRQTYSGPKNAGKILLLEGEMTWQEMGMSLKDMDFSQGKYMLSREIAQAFGVPAMLVGVPGESTFANYKEARFHLWEDTILPLLEIILRALNHALEDEFDAKIVYDIERIPALSARRETLWARLESASFLSHDEKREALGYGPTQKI